jgi:hypothetical protein
MQVDRGFDQDFEFSDLFKTHLFNYELSYLYIDFNEHSVCIACRWKIAHYEIGD